jgi:hypothetical protein
MVLMGIAALREGATNDRTELGRNRLETPTRVASRREAEERLNRRAAAENIVASPKTSLHGTKKLLVL